MVTIQKVKKNQHIITIPLTIMKIMGWERGDKLAFGMTEDKTLTLYRLKDGKAR